MGGGSWSGDTFSRAIKGDDAFAVSRDTLARPVDEWKPAKMLDPSGLKVRESRDSEEHPTANAIMVGLDITGSMKPVVVAVRDALGRLMEMLLGGAYIPDPQLLFYAIGDATCDRIPVQISQFESDNRIAEQLRQVVIEGGGGGQNTESYELGFYVAARHTSIDCLEKRGIRGYLFSIGDEMPYPEVDTNEVRNIFGAALQDNTTVEAVVQEAQAKYHIFHIIPRGSANFSNQSVRSRWVKLLGGSQFVLMLDDPTLVAETIAVAIGLNEKRLTLDAGLRIVADKVNQKAATVVGKALMEFAEYIGSQPDSASPKPSSGDPDNPKKPNSWKL